MIAPLYRRDQLTIVATMAVLLAGCSASGMNVPLSPLQGTQSARRAIDSGYKSLYSFKGGTDGSQPVSTLLDFNGKLYGATFLGGDMKCAPASGDGCGSVFEATDSGTARVLYRFGGLPGDGTFPRAGLIAVNGKLYGTTVSGGAAENGTVYEISPAGGERVVLRFGGVDGRGPFAGLLDVNGKLYGTTEHASRYTCYSNDVGCGNVFEADPSGNWRVVYNFKGPFNDDGSEPMAGLTRVNGVFYGTTESGGVHGSTDGVVFSVTTSGKEHLLHVFPSSSTDGVIPDGPLTLLNGKLYGTTVIGGAHRLGTVFEITPAGKERVIYSFKGPPADGVLPYGTLATIGNNLYGITPQGGSGKCVGSESGCGTVFEVSPSGKERVLYSFKGGKDGAQPSGGLTAVDGTLFGTTWAGGTGTCSVSASNSVGGCGTIFRITP
jgi:uncharacterized repeat protein (TIGR03803 family)